MLTDKDLADIKAIALDASNAAPVKRMEEIAEKAAERGAQKGIDMALKMWGINPEKPREMQDLIHFARDCKESSEQTKEVIRWGAQRMKEEGTLKRGFLSSVGGHLATAIVTFGLMWATMRAK